MFPCVQFDEQTFINKIAVLKFYIHSKWSEKSTCILASGLVGSADPTAIPTPNDDNKHLLSLPDKPYHPAATFSFPKRTFGVKKPVQCAT